MSTTTNGDRSHNHRHVAMLATPGMGHLIPLAELAKRLVSRHGFTATLITFASTDSSTQRAFLASLPPAISSDLLPPVSSVDMPEKAAIETLMSVECARSVPALVKVLNDIKSANNLVAFVTDLFGADSFDAAKEVDLPYYLFFPSNLLLLSLLLHLPAIDAETTCDFRDLPEPVRLPGCVPIPGTEILEPIQDRSRDCYPWMMHHGKKYREAFGIMVNTFDAIEPGAAKILRQPEPGRPPVYPIGPLIQTGEGDSAKNNHECLSWLDRQPPRSVLFVSFGSGGAITRDQMAELALGLENSGQSFLWVVRSPSDGGDVSANYYDAQSKKDPFAYLPEGFRDRTKERGFLVSSWAPQIKVLAHEATGGFLTHCGWNSTLESVVFGVPMIAWPLYAEQKQNAVMLVDGVGAALRFKKIDKEEIANVVEELMVGGEQGKKVREKVAELKAAAAEGLKESGAATAALDELVGTWISKN